MLELMGLMFALIWEFIKFALVLWVCLFVPVVLFIAASGFALAVIRFGWKEAAEGAKKKLDRTIGRKTG